MKPFWDVIIGYCSLWLANLTDELGVLSLKKKKKSPHSFQYMLNLLVTS